MAYIGKTPAASPLTSADITDGIIVEADLADDAVTADKLASNAVVNASVASDAAINDEKIAPPYYSAVSALPAASSHHGRVAHADSEGMMYYAHGGAWIALAKDTAKQDVDAGLTSISVLTTAADKMIYTTGSDTYAVSDLTAAGRALLDDADAAAQRNTLGLGTAATTAATAYATSTQGTKADNAAALADDQTFTGANRGTITVVTPAVSVTFDLTVTNNFSLTLINTSSDPTLNFPTLTAAMVGQSGNIYLDNVSGGAAKTISKASNILMTTANFNALSTTAGKYWLSYLVIDQTNVLVTASSVLA